MFIKFGIFIVVVTLYLNQCEATADWKSICANRNPYTLFKVCSDDYTKVFQCVCPSVQNNLNRILTNPANSGLRRFLRVACRSNSQQLAVTFERRSNYLPGTLNLFCTYIRNRQIPFTDLAKRCCYHSCNKRLIQLYC